MNDDDDALRKELFAVPTPSDAELQSVRRQSRVPDDSLIGELKRKDAAMQVRLCFAFSGVSILNERSTPQCFIDVFKRDWELLTFRHRPVRSSVLAIACLIARARCSSQIVEPLCQIDEVAPSLAVGDNLAGW